MKQFICFTFKCVIFTVLFLFSFHGFSQTSFIENKNQWHSNVLYKADLSGGVLFLEKNCFTYTFIKEEDIKLSPAHHNPKKNRTFKSGEENIVHFHAYKTHFVNSQNDARVIPQNPGTDYFNYFIGKDPAKWASHVKRFGYVRYEGLYTNIDLRVYAEKFSVKYDFIVNPGGQTGDIKVQYEGADSLYLENGNLIIKTSVNQLTELQPYAYQEYDGVKKKVACFYELNGNNLTYSFPEGYDKNVTLVIDPTLIFSTYSGSSADNWGFTATYDSHGNVYSGGIVFDYGYPVSAGAYQVNFNGGEPAGSFYYDGCDVGIIKYDPTGTQRLYATYLGGGNGEEMPHSLVVNEYDQLLIFGTTGSNDFPTTTGAFDRVFNGGTTVIYDNVIYFTSGIDIYVSKISEDGGQLLASTYVGGSGNDGLNYRPYINFNDNVLMEGNDSLYYNYADGARGEIITDGKNNVYVGTCTFSNNFPVTTNCVQPSTGGRQDGVVFKLDYNLTNMIWSTYLGGSMDDAIYSIDTDNDYDVIVSGGTSSSNFPTTTGAYDTNFNGGTTDGFVSHISSNGSSLVASSYFGSPNYDQAYFVRTDRYDNIFITGQTKAQGNTLIHNATYNVPNSGQFVAKLKPDLDSLIWSTVFGTGINKPNISITAFTVDVCSRVYISGWGRVWPGYPVDGVTYQWGSPFGTVNMPITANAQQPTTDGQDFYIMVLSDDASTLEYATYFGELHYTSCGSSGRDHVDGGTSRFDKRGNIYQSVCASCGSCNAFPTYPNPGVWAPDNGAAPSNNCNNAVFRFSFMDDFVVADFDAPPVGCAPYMVNFTNTSVGTQYHWDFGDGYTSTATNPNHTYTQSGVYYVQLIAGDPSSCNLADTITKEIQVLSNSGDTLPDAHICPNQQLQIGVIGNPNCTYTWTPATGLSNPNVSNPYATPAINTTYLLLVSNGICTDSIYQSVFIEANSLDIIASEDTMICSGEQIQISGSANGPTSDFLFSTSISFDPLITTYVNDSSVLLTPTSTDTYYIRANSQFCNFTDMDSVTIVVRSVAVGTNPDTTICKGDSIHITATNQVPGDVLIYSWTPPATILSGADTDSPLVKPLQQTTYQVSVTNQYGCDTSESVTVFVDDLVLALSKTDVACYGQCTGQATVIANGLPSYTYNWSNGTGSSIADSLCAGSYSVTVTDSIGCRKTSQVILTQPTQLNSAVTNVVNTLCDGTCSGQISVSSSGGTQPYSYAWTYGQTTQTVTGLCVGTYTVTITDTNGCTSTETEHITDPSDLEFTSNHQDVTCYGYCDGSALVTASQGIPPYYYVWNTGANSSQISSLCALDTAYIARITDSENCVREVHIIIHQPAPLASTATSPGIICNGESTSVTMHPSGGTALYTYQWSNMQSGQTATGLYAGTYTVTITDSHGCTKTSNVTVTEPTVMAMDSDVVRVSCEGACNGKIDLYMNGGVQPYNYVWTNGSQMPGQEGLCSGPYDVTVTDTKGCKHTYTFNVGTNPIPPSVDASADDYTLYHGQTTTLHAAPDTNYTFTWSPPLTLDDATIANPLASPLETTIYRVTIRDKNGCTNTDTLTIFVNDVICEEPYIYVPNAFYPGSTNDKNKKLYVFGNMIDKLYFAVYDRWGEQLFVTSDINTGWDGTYKGKAVDPAVFVYYLSATCLNGKIFTKKGNVTLIR